MRRRQYLALAGALPIAGCLGDRDELPVAGTPTTERPRKTTTRTTPRTDRPQSTPTETDTPTETRTATETSTPQVTLDRTASLEGPGYTGFEHTAVVSVTNEGPDAGTVSIPYSIQVPGKEAVTGRIGRGIDANETITWEETVVPSDEGSLSLSLDGAAVATAPVGHVVGSFDPAGNPPATVTFPDQNRVTMEAIGAGRSIRWGHGGNETTTAPDGRKFLGVRFDFANEGGRVLGMPYRHMWRAHAGGETYETTTVSDSTITEYYGFIEGTKYKSAPQTAGDSRSGVVLFEVPESVDPASVRFTVDWGWSYMEAHVSLRFVPG